MAELIDKGVTSKLIYNFFDSLIPSHYYKLDLVKAHDCLQEEINELPTVTEAEIRAKAIDEFAEKLGRLCKNSAMALDRYNGRPLYNKDGKWSDLINDVAEQLKEE